MTRLLIAGAGAEADLKLPSGRSFTKDTFYCRKNRMTDSLAGFYRGRLGKAKVDSIPTVYDRAFLFTARGRAFRYLVENLIRDNREIVAKVLRKSQEECKEVSDLEPGDFTALYDALIVEKDDGRTHQMPVSAIPDDTHFGILEDYYSELLKPNNHIVRFWKIINFYWSAFFSILLPITNQLYDHNEEYSEDRYKYVLSHLNKVVHDVFDHDKIGQSMPADCYYNSLKGCFDVVLTTNYTPYSEAVVNSVPENIVRLAGSLSQFEHLGCLEYEDYAEPDKCIGESDFVFPYLLCQAPVKPIISLNQIAEFTRAAEALNGVDEMVVLGYSFCDEDAHIASMVGETLRCNPTCKLTYFDYVGSDGSSGRLEETRSRIIRKLRVPESNGCQIEVVPIKSCKSAEFLRLTEKWRNR